MRTDTIITPESLIGPRNHTLYINGKKSNAPAIAVNVTAGIVSVVVPDIAVARRLAEDFNGEVLSGIQGEATHTAMLRFASVEVRSSKPDLCKAKRCPCATPEARA